MGGEEKKAKRRPPPAHFGKGGGEKALIDVSIPTRRRMGKKREKRRVRDKKPRIHS